MGKLVLGRNRKLCVEPVFHRDAILRLSTFSYRRLSFRRRNRLTRSFGVAIDRRTPGRPLLQAPSTSHDVRGRRPLLRWRPPIPTRWPPPAYSPSAGMPILSTGSTSLSTDRRCCPGESLITLFAVQPVKGQLIGVRGFLRFALPHRDEFNRRRELRILESSCATTNVLGEIDPLIHPCIEVHISGGRPQGGSGLDPPDPCTQA